MEVGTPFVGSFSGPPEACFPPMDTVIDLTERLGLKKGKLTFIPASSKAEDIVRTLTKGYELSLFRRVIEEVSEAYNLDYLFIDTHPGIEESTLVAMGACDSLLLVSRIDNQDIFGTGVTVEVARALKKPTFLIANMVPPGFEEENVKQRLGSLFNVPVIAAIPFYTEVLRALSSGVFILKNSEHDFSLKLQSVASGLLEGSK